MDIAILSRGPYLYSTQSLVRACINRGHNVAIVDHSKCNLSCIDDTPEIEYEGIPLRRFDAIIPRIGVSVTEQGAAVISQFEAMGVKTMTSSQALLLARDKMRCLQVLAGKRIPIPPTAMVGDLTYLSAQVNKLGGYPIIIKTLESTHGEGVSLAENERQALTLIHTYLRYQERILVQAFIAEAKGADIRAFVVDGKVVASMLRQAAPGEFRSNLHRGATGITELLSEREQQLAIESTQAMGLTIAGVDILRSNNGPLLLEVNASPGLEGIETITGVDVAGAIVEAI